MAMKPNNTHDLKTINFNYDADEELYVSDPVDVPALKKALVTFSFDMQTLDSAGWQRIRAAINNLRSPDTDIFAQATPRMCTSSTVCILIWRMSMAGNNTCRIFPNLRCGLLWILSGIGARLPGTITMC